MRAFVRIIFLLLLLGGPISDAQAQLSAREYLNRGNRQLSKNDFPNAIGDYTKALELDPILCRSLCLPWLRPPAQR